MSLFSRRNVTSSTRLASFSFWLEIDFLNFSVSTWSSFLVQSWLSCLIFLIDSSCSRKRFFLSFKRSLIFWLSWWVSFCSFWAKMLQFLQLESYCSVSLFLLRNRNYGKGNRRFIRFRIVCRFIRRFVWSDLCWIFNLSNKRGLDTGQGLVGKVVYLSGEVVYIRCDVVQIKPRHWFKIKCVRVFDLNVIDALMMWFEWVS